MKINKSKFDVIINILCLLCLIGTAVYLIITWDKIPPSIPGHYIAAGEVDKMTNKSSSIILLIVGLIMFIGISIIEWRKSTSSFLTNLFVINVWVNNIFYNSLSEG